MGGGAVRRSLYGVFYGWLTNIGVIAAMMEVSAVE